MPEAFSALRTPDFNEEEWKCRLHSLRWGVGRKGRPYSLTLEFSKISYGDYLRSGEHLDEQFPNEPIKTFRDEYMPALSSTHDFSSSQLTNISGVGVFLLTRDNYVILSRHSDKVYVMGRVVSYSSSGTMDWSDRLHPFSEVIRECEEEIGVNVSSDDLRLFSVGIDAKRFYFQFSFFAETAYTGREILDMAIQARDYSFEFESLIAIPFDVESVVSLVKNEIWEPAAQAGLLTLCAKRYGRPRVERALDEGFVRARYRESMRSEWARRASRSGDFAVMSDRYPYHQMASKSEEYARAVAGFLAADVDGKDVVEFGCGIGRLTKFLVERAGWLVCIDLNEEMIRRTKECLGRSASDVEFRACFAQDYRPERRHDVAVCSLVLVHNTDDLAFTEMIRAVKNSADTIFLFEHCDPHARTSSGTKTRTVEELLAHFPEYQVARHSTFLLFDDEIAFLKLTKRKPVWPSSLEVRQSWE